jgi:hypothetical protein
MVNPKRIQKGFVLISAALACFSLTSLSDDLLSEYCKNDNLELLNSRFICYQPSNSSWLSWALGGSSSPQLHFIDFMELLHQNEH